MKILRSIFLGLFLSISMINAADLYMIFSYTNLENMKTYRVERQLSIDTLAEFSDGDFTFSFFPVGKDLTHLFLNLKITKDSLPIWVFEDPYPPLVTPWNRPATFSLEDGKNFYMSLVLIATQPNNACSHRTGRK